MMYKKHASKNLIDSLAYLGLCASYYKTQKCETCINAEEIHIDMADIMHDDAEYDKQIETECEVPSSNNENNKQKRMMKKMKKMKKKKKVKMEMKK